MRPAKLLYIDRHGISVTRFTLKVKHNAYPIKTISYRPVEWKPANFRIISVLILGLVLSASGYANAATNSVLTFSTVALFIGILLLPFALIALFLNQKRYALQISSSKGVKNIIVRRQKESILKIVQALDTANELNASFKK